MNMLYWEREVFVRSDIHDIWIQLLKPYDIYSWIVIFGHKSPKEPIFPPSESLYAWNKHIWEASAAYTQ